MAKKYTADELNEIRKQYGKLVLEQDVRYLLIDKQVTSRRSILNALASAKVDNEYILEAGDGIDGIAQASRTQTPFIVIMEAKLSDMKGEDFIARLRSKPGHEQDKVVLYTGETKRDIVAPVLQAGVAGLLKKPMAPQEITAKLIELELLEP
ncbi:MAG: response regulator [Planctomycetota bacterium]|jgi:DNA-binding NarL/FixJ family response regulator